MEELVNFKLTEAFFIMISLVVTSLHTFVKVHQTVPLNLRIHSKLYLNKTDLKS